jgi:hypothetical protein
MRFKLLPDEHSVPSVFDSIVGSPRKALGDFCPLVANAPVFGDKNGILLGSERLWQQRAHGQRQA